MGLTQIIKRNGKVVDFEPEKIYNSIQSASESAGGLKQDMDLLPHKIVEELYPQYWRLEEKEIVERLTYQVLSYLKYYSEKARIETLSVEDVQDTVEYVLADQAFIDPWESFRIYRWGRTAVRDGKITEEQFSGSGLPDKKCQEIEEWNKKHGCDTIAGLNEIVRDPKAYKRLIESCIQVYKNELDNIASLYFKDPRRIILISGPSSSGKTTTTHKVCQMLKREGLIPKEWTLDNYYRGVNNLPKDRFGDCNYEEPEALDIRLIRKHLNQLFDGQEIEMPNYNFDTGLRDGISGKMKLGKNEVLVVDSLYSISPKMFTDKVLPEKAFKIYIETLNMVKNSQGRYVKLTDNRLLRRMARDVRPLSEGGRNYSLEWTLGHWHYVRNGELRDLIPFINTAGYVINGGLAFELAILKGKLNDIIPDLEQFREDKRWDAYIRGNRIKKIFGELESASDKYVPPDCHLREFIGGLELELE